MSQLENLSTNAGSLNFGLESQASIQGKGTHVSRGRSMLDSLFANKKNNNSKDDGQSDYLY